MPTKEEWEKWQQTMDERVSTMTQTIKELKKQGSPGERDPTESNHPLHTFDDLLDCPDCYPKLKDKVLTKEFKDKELVKCKECGVPESKEAEKCWNCGSTEAETF